METLGDYIEKSFTESKKWRCINFHDHDKLVVDSRGLFERLYLSRQPWEFGGEYGSFYSTVREFFGELLSTGINLIIVFHGPEPHEKSKLHLTRKRKTEANEWMWRCQRHLKWQSVGPHSRGTIPHLAWSVFVQIVRKLGLTCYVTKEPGLEGRREISAVANHHQCPVLGASADYFLFELNQGYIPFDTVSTVIANGLLYHTSEFQALHSLKCPHLRFLIPAVYGNSFVEEIPTAKADLSLFLRKVSSLDTLEAYLANEMRENVQQKIAENFETAKKFYLISESNYQSYQETTFFDHDFPDYIVKKTREGLLDTEIINVVKQKTYVLCDAVENVSKDSAWLSSRPIRLYCYGLVLPQSAEGQVREILRAKGSPEVSEVLVTPLHFNPPLNVGDLSTSRDVPKLRRLLLKVSGISEGSMPDDFFKEFDSLDRMFKLPVCAACYWYKTCDSIQRHLVKTLIVTFLTCSDMVRFDDQRCTLESLNSATKQDHYSTLHAFAQWQCVYHDLVMLNTLLEEPFTSANPALLFSGRMALFYASFARKSRSPEEVIHRSSEAWRVYNNCLYLITGFDAEGRKSGPAKAKAATGASAQKQTKEENLRLSNRFDALSSLDS